MNGLIKRGKFWNYDFQFNGKRRQGSTRHTNKEEAAKWLRAFRTNLVNEGVGLIKPVPLPLLTDFLNNEFKKLVDQQSETEGTKIAYKKSIRRMVAAPCFLAKPLDQITDKEVSAYKQHRLALQNAVATINGDLGVLRKALRWADDGLNLIRYRRITSLPGAKNRTFVLSAELEKEYLAVVPYPLKQVATLMLDLGLRPEEAVALRKRDVTDNSVTVIRGKTSNASRSLPQTERTKAVFQFMAELFPCEHCGTPRMITGASEDTAWAPSAPMQVVPQSCECWVFPGRQGKHLTAHAVSNLHGLIWHKHDWPEEFVLYSCRHTAATRWGESGMHPITMKALLGHSSIKMTERYTHPGIEHLAVAMKQAELYARFLRGESDGVPAKSTTEETPTQ